MKYKLFVYYLIILLCFRYNMDSRNDMDDDEQSEF